jgi:hypothetical protein
MKLFLKTGFVLAVMGLLILMGMKNRSSVTFNLEPVLPKPISQPAALMYFGFFIVGFATAKVLSGGGGKADSSGGSAKPAKPKLVK